VFLALTRWRDEAAMKAGAGQQAGNIVYEVVASA
jgi:hypothetical protein